MPPALDAVLYAKDLRVMSLFYAAVLGRSPVKLTLPVASLSVARSVAGANG
ncbi:MAG: hypothetical protein ACKVS7_13365 [Gemmatimonadaceae bacterium]